MTDWPARLAEVAEFPAIAKVWHDAWHEAHAGHVPAALTRQRTFESFLDRLHGFGDRLRVAGPGSAPLGMCVIREDEMQQLFVSPAARGSGLAARLLCDAEVRLTEGGVTEAWLDVVAQNVRARRFYARHGWRDRGIETVTLDAEGGGFDLRAVVMVKRLRRVG